MQNAPTYAIIFERTSLFNTWNFSFEIVNIKAKKAMASRDGIIAKRSKTVLFAESCDAFELSRQSKTEAYILLITVYFCYVFDIFTG